MIQQVTVLGATGSIGLNTLDVIRRHPERYSVFALTASTNVGIMKELITEFSPEHVVMAASEAHEELKAWVAHESKSTRVSTGEQNMCSVAGDNRVDIVMAAVVGAAGLLPTLAAAKAGKKVLLANKESLVMAGPLFMEAVKKGGATLLPIDSEHNAIFQSLPSSYDGSLACSGVRHLLLTASGGPFRGYSKTDLHSVTPAQAVNHPNWSMGAKISVDSATLMNKGLELIEACYLFNCKASDVKVVVHPQSVIHSMVQYVDGSVMAQLGQPDMRTPIAYGLAWPERIESGVDSVNFFECGQFDFEAADEETFECLALARDAFVSGGTMPAVLNAANEIAVDAFLRGVIKFSDIPVLIKSVMAQHQTVAMDSIETVLTADAWARDMAEHFVARGFA